MEITGIPKLQVRKLRLREVSQVSKLVRGDTGNHIATSLENQCSLLLETSWGRVREQMASGLEAVLVRGGSPTLLDMAVAHLEGHRGCLLAKLHFVTHFHYLREQQTRRRLLNLLLGVTHVTSVHISLGRQVIWPDLLLELGKLARSPRVHARPKVMPASLVVVRWVERSEDKGEHGREVHFTGRQLRVGRKVMHLDLDIEQEVLSWLPGLRRMPWTGDMAQRALISASVAIIKVSLCYSI